MSAGAAAYQQGDTPESLLDRADDQMYLHKRKKREAALTPA
jgi:PleD family two-component response regulator